MGDGVHPAIDELVDLARYPLSDPADPGRARLVDRVRAELAATGCSVLPDFVPPARHDELRAQCAGLADRAHYQVETVNVYNTALDATLPPEHPGAITMRRGNAFVPRDEIPGRHLIHRLYTSEPFQAFIAACFGLPRVFPLADPLSGLCLNVVLPGRAHPWHFDTNEFTVSLLTQPAESGGVFEYCPGIRSAGAENLEAVASVLTGRGGQLIQRLPLRPGDLQLFTGRYSLHRVSTVAGRTARHSAIFAYSERPDVIGTPARTRQLFGRVTEAHLAAGDQDGRVDRLLI
jgi:hypothetical protein